MSIADLQKVVSDGEGDATVDQSSKSDCKGESAVREDSTTSPTKSSWRGTAKKQTSWKKNR
jgi:hypothetical protein